MRFLPYVLAAFMLAPIGIWLVIQFVVLDNGSLTRMAPDQLYQAVSLGGLAILSIGLLSWWMSKLIARTAS